MNKERVMAWVAALRSGEYEQTQGCLHKDNAYCCLGIGCVVAMKGGLELELGTSYANRVTYDGHAGGMPGKVREWFGGDPAITITAIYNGEQHSLADLNDVYSLSFNQIADCLEETYLK